MSSNVPRIPEVAESYLLHLFYRDEDNPTTIKFSAIWVE